MKLSLSIMKVIKRHRKHCFISKGHYKWINGFIHIFNKTQDVSYYWFALGQSFDCKANMISMEHSVMNSLFIVSVRQGHLRISPLHPIQVNALIALMLMVKGTRSPQMYFSSAAITAFVHSLLITDGKQDYTKYYSFFYLLAYYQSQRDNQESAHLHNDIERKGDHKGLIFYSGQYPK